MKLYLIPNPAAVGYLQGFTSAGARVNKIKDSRFGDEAFSLHIENEITIKASTPKGLFYAEMLLDEIRYQCGRNLQNVHIEDSPRFDYRAFMIDSCRHFFPVKDIKKMIHTCAKLRFNVFHWHLTEDQGWRIQINKYPVLTEVGSVREGSHFGSEQSDEPYGGFYTQEEIRQVVEYAHQHHMRVVPEIDLPGHCSALLSAMPELSCTGERIKAETTNGIFKNLVCAGKENVFEVIFDILDELCQLFPDEYIHLGGDEAPKHSWKKCPHCQSRMAENGLDTEEALQGYFMNRINDYLKEKGKTLINWNESLRSGNLDEDIIIQFWNGLAGGVKDVPNKIINSSYLHCYADLLYHVIPLKKCYEFDPMVNKNVIGTDYPIWTEYVKDIDQMEYMCFPRFVAGAQNSWSKNKCSYSEFRQALTELWGLLGEVNVAPPEDWDPFPLTRGYYATRRLASGAKSPLVRRLFGEKPEE